METIDFGKMFKKLRIKKGLLQSEVSDILMISKTSISNYEQGHRQPDLETLIKIADFFNCSTDYLLGVSSLRNEDEIFLLFDEFDVFTNELNKFSTIEKQEILLMFQQALIILLQFKHNKTLYNRFLKSFENIICIFNDFEHYRENNYE